MCYDWLFIPVILSIDESACVYLQLNLHFLPDPHWPFPNCLRMDALLRFSYSTQGFRLLCRAHLRIGQAFGRGWSFFLTLLRRFITNNKNSLFHARSHLLLPDLPSSRPLGYNYTLIAAPASCEPVSTQVLLVCTDGSANILGCLDVSWGAVVILPPQCSHDHRGLWSIASLLRYW